MRWMLMLQPSSPISITYLLPTYTNPVRPGRWPGDIRSAAPVRLSSTWSVCWCLSLLLLSLQPRLLTEPTTTTAPFRRPTRP